MVYITCTHRVSPESLGRQTSPSLLLRRHLTQCNGRFILCYRSRTRLHLRIYLPHLSSSRTARVSKVRLQGLKVITQVWGRDKEFTTYLDRVKNLRHVVKRIDILRVTLLSWMKCPTILPTHLSLYISWIVSQYTHKVYTIDKNKNYQ